MRLLLAANDEIGAQVDQPRVPLPGERGWAFTLWPDAAEGGGAFRSYRKGKSGLYERDSHIPPVPDLDRSKREAGRRARAVVRRYCVANRLNRLITLTYAEACRDPNQLRADVAAFWPRLREVSRKSQFPYLWVPELHPGGHGFHVHAAVNWYIPRRDIEEAWGRGFVHIKLLGDLPLRYGLIDEARVAAGYLGKYVAKGFDESEELFRAAGMHRYDRAQGFNPKSVRLRSSTKEGVLRQASYMVGSAPIRTWESDSVEGWSGPPAIWAQW